jgi:hypothetical protein
MQVHLALELLLRTPLAAFKVWIQLLVQMLAPQQLVRL